MNQIRDRHAKGVIIETDGTELAYAVETRARAVLYGLECLYS